MAKPPQGTTPEQQTQFFQIGKLNHHILLCAGNNCCTAAEGDAAWTYLKRRVAELHLDQSPYQVFRTKCACLRVCVGGPILVVYPEGIWYKAADPLTIERILQEHILQGNPIAELQIGHDDLHHPG